MEKDSEPAKTGECATGRGAGERTRSPQGRKGPTHPVYTPPPRAGGANKIT